MIPLTFLLSSIHAECDDEDSRIRSDYYASRISLAEMWRRLARTNKIRQLVYAAEEHVVREELIADTEPVYSAERDSRSEGP